MSDVWTRADDRRCDACEWHRWETAFKPPLAVCANAACAQEVGVIMPACQVARSPQGRCGPAARFYKPVSTPGV